MTVVGKKLERARCPKCGSLYLAKNYNVVDVDGRGLPGRHVLICMDCDACVSYDAPRTFFRQRGVGW